MRLRHDAHRVGEGLIEDRAVVRLTGRDIAPGECIEVVPLPRTGHGTPSQAGLQGGPGRGDGLFEHRCIDVRPVGERLAPVGHSAVGIQLGGGAERPDGLLVVEVEQQQQALVKIPLGLR